MSKVIQLAAYRIVIVYPPLSDGLEITVVKPIKKLSLEDYNLDENIIDLFKNKAK
jgi:ATPase